MASNPFPVSGQLAEALAALQAKLQQNLMDYDYQEQAKRRLYEDNLYQLGQDRLNGSKQLTANLIDRGLNRSGIALNAETDFNKGMDTKQAGFAQDLNSALASLARQRLAAQSNYDLGKAQLQRQTAGGMLRMA